jgi:hypothetical protein
VRDLAAYCRSIGVLLVISSRERLRWAEHYSDWKDGCEQHELKGLLVQDAQEFLAKTDIGPHPPKPPIPLQQAIITCCTESSSDQSAPVQCHPLLLALCADSVLNERRQTGIDPEPDSFRTIPGEDTARQLTDRFLRSLHNTEMQSWVEELSLTPRFDEKAALALGRR